MKFKDFLAQPPIEEAESNYIAMSAYKANDAKIRMELEKLDLNLMRHRERYLKTDRKNWGFSGDLERVATQLKELNDFLGGSQ